MWKLMIPPVNFLFHENHLMFPFEHIGGKYHKRFRVINFSTAFSDHLINGRKVLTMIFVARTTDSQIVNRTIIWNTFLNVERHRVCTSIVFTIRHECHSRYTSTKRDYFESFFYFHLPYFLVTTCGYNFLVNRAPSITLVEPRAKQSTALSSSQWIERTFFHLQCKPSTLKIHTRVWSSTATSTRRTISRTTATVHAYAIIYSRPASSFLSLLRRPRRPRSSR